MQVLEKMWNLSQAFGKGNSNGGNSTRKGKVWEVTRIILVALSLHISKEAWIHDWPLPISGYVVLGRFIILILMILLYTSKYVKLVASGSHASFIWFVLPFEFDMLNLGQGAMLYQLVRIVLSKYQDCWCALVSLLGSWVSFGMNVHVLECAYIISPP